MEIRPLAPADDLRAVSRVYEESWRTAYRGIVPQPYLDAIPAGRWCPALRAPGRTSLLLLDGGEIAGTVSFSRSRDDALPDDGEIISLYLRPAWQGRGLGGALLGAAVETLAVQGYAALFLWVLEDNRPARRFYERHGFAWNGDTQEATIGGKPLRELRYVLLSGGGAETPCTKAPLRKGSCQPQAD